MACYAVYPAGRCFQHHHTGSIPGVQPTEEFVQQPSGTFFPPHIKLTDHSDLHTDHFDSC